MSFKITAFLHDKDYVYDERDDIRIEPSSMPGKYELIINRRLSGNVADRDARKFQKMPYEAADDFGIHFIDQDDGIITFEILY
jgi:hypothetical protein